MASSPNRIKRRDFSVKTEYRPKVVDLFCGCGGLSSGLRSAGFDIVAGADKEPKFMKSFKINFPSSSYVEGDLSSMRPEELMDDLSIAREELDLLAGGPPCQGFSKNVPRGRRTAESTQNLLMFTFLDYCEAFMPRSILLENVAEMRNGFSSRFRDVVMGRLRTAGYSVIDCTLNAAAFGVPQMRRRAFVIALRGDVRPEVPTPTHSAPSNQAAMDERREYVRVWEAIGDLPSLLHGEGTLECTYASSPQSAFQSRVRNTEGRVRNHVARRLRPKQLARMTALKPGQGNADLPKGLRAKASYSGAYGRLTKDMVAPTITRWMFHPGSGRWGHPVDDRTLTIREAARIQGFEDSFVFEGSFVDQSGQIGNAVPPLLAEEIGKSVLRALEG